MPEKPLIDEYPHWVDETVPSGPGILNIHIFGPYRNDYQNILKEMAEYLRDNGYPGAKICTEIPNHDRPDDMSQPEFNWWESVFCMRNADAALFVFLESRDARLGDAPAQGLNSSAFAELAYWTHFFAPEKVGTHVIFEGEMSNKGSLIEGLIDLTDATQINVDPNDLESIKEHALTTCVNWVQ
ncbi:hypothetical protein [Halanaeroarchaeum sulfurireducens]|uniref:Nucleoside 2-deoxyribosyltransferase n=1 Tax=Halanaeroarchaeum sulfurireducens TaxID=1604004 RepID=A0A0F7PAL7_9EURY|nr:hypothetical protein [Halanaeroarchaeum sulfurireducens]AKH98216.1 hypothetical protein HLASF_1743 [Halanaeroarchaeum sulfurireducens]ALG82610.1 hypothetical protein HLASA_1729 [Halanaeroarchaeum sulfurireducens]